MADDEQVERDEAEEEQQLAAFLAKGAAIAGGETAFQGMRAMGVSERVAVVALREWEGRGESRQVCECE